MKAYKAKIINTPDTLERGSIYQHVVVFAKDFVGATMEAQHALEGLQSALKAAECPKESWSTLEVDSIEHVCEVVDRFGLLDQDQESSTSSIEAWARTIAQKTKQDVDA